MTPSLPVALAILTFLSIPAAAAPDFAVMRECGPKHYERYQKASGFEKGDPKALAEKLELINEVLDSAGSYADSISRPGSDAPALPPGCELNEAKIKDEVYGGLADLRRKINDKAADALPEEDKEPTRNLTAIEGELDAAMGEAKDLAALKSKLRGIVDKVSAAEGGAPESAERRVLRLKKRIGAILVRISEKQGAGASSFDQAIPAEVLARDAKRVEEAKKRAGAAKGLSFGGDKTDNTPNAGAGNAASGGRASPGTNTPRGGAENAVIEEDSDPDDAPAKKVRRPRVDSRLENAIIEEGPDPDDEGPSVLTEAVKNSATKPLAGAVNPSSENDANSRNSREERSRRTLERLEKIERMPDSTIPERADKAHERDSIGSGVVGRPANGEGEIYLKRANTNAPPTAYKVSGYKLTEVKPGDLTPEEEAVIKFELAKLKRLGK